MRISEFEKQCKEIGLTEENIREIENLLLENSQIGDIIQGTGGIRKIRYALPGKGKSGGVRVILLDFTHYERTYFITVYEKGERENLSKAECNGLKILSKALEASEKERYRKLKKGGKK